MKLIILVEAVPYSGNRSFQWKPFLLVEVIHFNGNQCPQWKPFLLVEAIPFSGSYSFLWKPLPLVEDIPFSGSHSFQWKPFLFIGSHSLQLKLFLLLEAIPFIFFQESLFFWWKSLPAVETNLFGRSLLFLVEGWWKLLLLIETFPFSGSHSFQCFNIFTSRSYQNLPEYLNINDSVRSLKMANLSCIHIPGEVFQNSEGYLESSRASGVESF